MARPRVGVEWCKAQRSARQAGGRGGRRERGWGGDGHGQAPDLEAKLDLEADLDLKADLEGRGWADLDLRLEIAPQIEIGDLEAGLDLQANLEGGRAAERHLVRVRVRVRVSPNLT